MAPTLCELSILFIISSLYCYVRLNVYVTLVAVNISLTLLMTLAWYRYSYWLRQGIQGPTYLPFCGDFSETITTLNLKIHHRYSRWVGKFGKVFGLYGGGIPMLAVADRDLAKEILYHNDNFNDIEVDVQQPRNGEFRFFNMQLTRLNGEKWRAFRNFMSSAFTAKAVDKLLPQVHESCHTLLQCLDEKVSDNTLFPVQIKKFITWQISEMFTKITTQFSSETAAIFHGRGETTFRVDSSVGHIRNHFPFLYKILTFEGVVNRSSRVVQTQMEKAQLNEKKHEQQSIPESTEPVVDYLTTMRLKRKQLLERNQANKFVPSENEIFAQLFNFLDPNNRSNVLTALFFELASNPEIQDQCRLEVSRINDLSSLKTCAEIESNLPLVMASLYETLRLYPVIRQLVRVPVNDTTSNGISIPKGCNILILIRDIMRDPAFFPNADLFQPLRFIGKSVTDYKKEGSYLAFGIGVRRCIGEKLGTTLLALVTANLLTNYEFHLVNPCQKGHTTMVEFLRGISHLFADLGTLNLTPPGDMNPTLNPHVQLVPATANAPNRNHNEQEDETGSINGDWNGDAGNDLDALDNSFEAASMNILQNQDVENYIAPERESAETPSTSAEFHYLTEMATTPTFKSNGAHEVLMARNDESHTRQLFPDEY